MSRLVDAILDQKAFARGATNPMLDLTHGGQMGWAPNLTEWISNQAYVRKNLVCILLEAPRFFQLMPEPQKWVACLKSLLELHARTIEGYNAGLEAEFDEHDVGGGGEKHHELVNMKREQSVPVFGFVEKYGMPIQTFIQNWMLYGGMDPETKYALVGTLSGDKPTDMLADWFTATVLVFEPDPTHRKVMKAWVTTNMFPKRTGEIVGKRDLTASSELTNLSIEFTGISQYGIGTNLFAQKILDSINITNANPYLRPSFIQNISADVAAAAGYEASVENLGATAVPV